VEEQAAKQAKYRLTTTIMLSLLTDNNMIDLSGAMTRQVEKECQFLDHRPHLVNIGELIEEMENKLRHTLDQIYFSKTRDIVKYLRNPGGVAREKLHKQMQQGIRAEMGQ